MTGIAELTWRGWRSFRQQLYGGWRKDEVY